MRTALVLALASVAWCGGLPTYGPPRQLAVLANPRIRESSGLACSRRTPGVFWTHNDSGDRPRLYAFDSAGVDLGTFELKGASALDWEDMASFTRKGRSYLLVGDIGDNEARRSHCTLLLAAEPAIDRNDLNKKLDVLRTIRFTFEGGPRNCESLAVCPKTGAVFLVEKAVGAACGVYAFPWPKGDGPQVAKLVARIVVPIATAMDISADGLRMVVLTYASALEFARSPDELWKEALARRPRLLSMPPRRQGESIAYGPQGLSLYLTSEKRPTPLLLVPATAP
jgi:hypothetical protein